MNKSEHALERFLAGVNCSQAVVGEFAEECAVDETLVMKMACGFGGGVGGMGHMCGAVTGAVMVIGLRSCGSDSCDPIRKARTYGLVRSFVHEFTARNQSLSCRELLDLDISTPEGSAEAKRLGLMETRCPGYVRDAVELLEEMF